MMAYQQLGEKSATKYLSETRGSRCTCITLLTQINGHALASFVRSLKTLNGQALFARRRVPYAHLCTELEMLLADSCASRNKSHEVAHNSLASPVSYETEEELIVRPFPPKKYTPEISGGARAASRTELTAPSGESKRPIAVKNAKAV